MLVKEKLYTIADWWEISSQPDNAHQLLELIEGEMKEMTSSFVSSITASKILGEIGIYLKTFPTGYLTTCKGGYSLSKNDIFLPDVGFIRKERLPERPERYVKVPPDLAVEVVSPTDLPQEVHLKAMRYIELGTKLVWVVYPARKMIHVYRPAETGVHVQAVEGEGVLDGSEILPGFHLAVQDIFAGLE